MKRFVPFVLVFGLITGLSCSSDDDGEAASMTRSAEAPAATDGSDTVDLTMQSDLDDLEQRIQELEDQLANLPAGPAGPAGPQGPAGPAGADGSQGPAGPTGPQGPAGPTGADGVQGSIGATGATGATGAAGSDGALSGLTCSEEQFVATISGDWVCAVLDGTGSANMVGTLQTTAATMVGSIWVQLDGANFCCDVSDMITQNTAGQYTDIDPIRNADSGLFEMIVDNYYGDSFFDCSLRGEVNDIAFDESSPGVSRFTNRMYIEWPFIDGVSDPFYSGRAGEIVWAAQNCDGVDYNASYGDLATLITLSNASVSGDNWATDLTCDAYTCNLGLDGVPNHTVCVLQGNVGNAAFSSTSLGVSASMNQVTIDWVPVLGEPLYKAGSGQAFMLNLDCGGSYSVAAAE